MDIFRCRPVLWCQSVCRQPGLVLCWASWLVCAHFKVQPPLQPALKTAPPAHLFFCHRTFCRLALGRPLFRGLGWQLFVHSAQLSAAKLAISAKIVTVSLLLCRYLSGSTLIQDSIQSLGVGPDMQLSDMPEHGEQTVRGRLLRLRAVMQSPPDSGRMLPVPQVACVSALLPLYPHLCWAKRLRLQHFLCTGPSEAC